MAIHDTIGDFITTLRNGSMATKPVVSVLHSKLRESIASILKQQGYLFDYTVKVRSNGIKDLEIKLKFKGDQPVIAGIRRESKPGCRRYYQYEEIPQCSEGWGLVF